MKNYTTVINSVKTIIWLWKGNYGPNKDFFNMDYIHKFIIADMHLTLVQCLRRGIRNPRIVHSGLGRCQAKLTLEKVRDWRLNGWQTCTSFQFLNTLCRQDIFYRQKYGHLTVSIIFKYGPFSKENTSRTMTIVRMEFKYHLLKENTPRTMTTFLSVTWSRKLPKLSGSRQIRQGEMWNIVVRKKTFLFILFSAW